MTSSPVTARPLPPLFLGPLLLRGVQTVRARRRVAGTIVIMFVVRRFVAALALAALGGAPLAGGLAAGSTPAHPHRSPHGGSGHVSAAALQTMAMADLHEAGWFTTAATTAGVRASATTTISGPASGSRTVHAGAVHTVTLLAANRTLYVDASEEGLRVEVGLPLKKARALANRWLAIRPGARPYHRAARGLSASAAASLLQLHAPLHRSARHRLDGRRVIGIVGQRVRPKATMTLYVTPGRHPLPVEEVGDVPGQGHVVISFSDIGQPEAIGYPAHAHLLDGRRRATTRRAGAKHHAMATKTAVQLERAGFARARHDRWVRVVRQETLRGGRLVCSTVVGPKTGSFTCVSTKEKLSLELVPGKGLYLFGNAEGLVSVLPLTKAHAEALAGRWLELRSGAHRYRALAARLSLANALARIRLAPARRGPRTVLDGHGARELIGMAATGSGASGTGRLFVVTGPHLLPLGWSGKILGHRASIAFYGWGVPAHLVPPAHAVVLRDRL